MITRVLLDTSVVGNQLEEGEPRLDIAAIRGRLWKYRISLADSFGEFLTGLMKGGLFESWNRNIGEIDAILDPRWPILPGGRGLAALAGTQTDLSAEIVDPGYYQAIWRWLSSSTSVEMLERGTTYTAANGTRVDLPFDRERIAEVTKSEREGWINAVNAIRDNARNPRKASFENILAIVRENFGSEHSDPPNIMELYDGVFRMIARMAELSLQSRDPLNPAGRRRRGDVFDFLLLYALPLPAVICTNDGPLRDRLRGTGARDAMQVISIEEFNNHARNDTLERLVAHHRTSSEQFRMWQKAAYFRWINNGQPGGSELDDWLATEPIA